MSLLYPDVVLLAQNRSICPPEDVTVDGSGMKISNGWFTIFFVVILGFMLAVCVLFLCQARALQIKNRVMHAALERRVSTYTEEQLAAMADAEEEEGGEEEEGPLLPQDRNIGDVLAKQAADEQRALAAGVAVVGGGVAVAMLFGEQIKDGLEAAVAKGAYLADEADQALKAAESLASDGQPLAEEGCAVICEALPKLAQALPTIQMAALLASIQEAGPSAFETGAPKAFSAALDAVAAAAEAAGSLADEEAIQAFVAAARAAQAFGAMLSVAQSAANEKQSGAVSDEAIEAASKLRLAAVPVPEMSASHVKNCIGAMAELLPRPDMQALSSAVDAAAGASAGCSLEDLIGTEAAGAVTAGASSGWSQSQDCPTELAEAYASAVASHASARVSSSVAGGTGGSNGGSGRPKITLSTQKSFAKKVGFAAPKSGTESWWITDSAFIENKMQEASSCCGKCVESYGVDTKIFEIVRDWAQLMSLIFSMVMPTAPIFHFGLQFVFFIIALDLSFLLGIFGIKLVLTWNVFMLILGIVLLLLLQLLELTHKKKADELTQGAESLTYADRINSTTRRLRIIQACHFVYLPICRTVFETIILFFSVESEGNFYIGLLALVVFFGFVIYVPFKTQSLIKVNAPRGSTEEPDFTFDEGGNRVRLTDTVFLEKVKAMVSVSSPNYNPWGKLFSGYERAWVQYPVAVMIFKMFFTAATVFLRDAKLHQTLLALSIIVIWVIIIKLSTPYVEQKADAVDFATKAMQLLTLLMSLCAVLVCKSSVPHCTTPVHCYSPGNAGFNLGIISNAIAAISILYLSLVVAQSMPCYKLRVKNKLGLFSFTEHNPGTHEDAEVAAMDASLIWYLSRELKYRVWYPFWQSLIESLDEKDKTSEGAMLVERWQEIKAQAMDAGVHRINEWLDNCENDRVMAARKALVDEIEGIDVYCDFSCLTQDEDTEECAELIHTSHGGDKILSTQTSFGKMYVTPFPTRAIFVWDDCDDRAALYDRQIEHLVALNMHPVVKEKVLLRLQLRCMHNQKVFFPFTRNYETVNEKKGNLKEHVQTTLTYTWATLIVCGNDPNSNSMKTHNTEFDLSAGFAVALNFTDGSGTWVSTIWEDGRKSNFHHGDNGTLSGMPYSIGHEEIGLRQTFERGSRGTLNREGLFSNFRSPGIDDLILDNAHLTHPQGKPMADLLAMRQRYRDDRQNKFAERETILPCRFWPLVFNDAATTKETLSAWINDNCSKFFSEKFQAAQEAQEFLWARHEFVSASNRSLHWMTFWDDLWDWNHKMAIFKGKEDVFGSAESSCLMYKPLERPELEALLDEHGVLGTSQEEAIRDKKPFLFSTELLDKLYNEQARATSALHLTLGRKRHMQNFPAWRPAALPPIREGHGKLKEPDPNSCFHVKLTPTRKLGITFDFVSMCIIEEVIPESPLRLAGVAPGDVLRAINGQIISNNDEIKSAVSSAKVDENGDQILSFAFGGDRVYEIATQPGVVLGVTWQFGPVCVVTSVTPDSVLIAGLHGKGVHADDLLLKINTQRISCNEDVRDIVSAAQVDSFGSKLLEMVFAPAQDRFMQVSQQLPDAGEPPGPLDRSDRSPQTMELQVAHVVCQRNTVDFSASMGITFDHMPLGLLLTSIAPGCAMAGTGLVPGDIVSEIGGVSTLSRSGEDARPIMEALKMMLKPYIQSFPYTTQHHNGAETHNGARILITVTFIKTGRAPPPPPPAVLTPATVTAEAIIPDGLQAGDAFQVAVNGQTIQVIVPDGLGSGDKIMVRT